jgi:hypothetical protein
MLRAGSGSGGSVVVRARLPNRPFSIFLGVSLRGVFVSERKKSVAHTGIGRIAGKAAATLGLLAKIKGLRHGPTRNEAGVRSGLSVAGRLSIVADNPGSIVCLCPV